MKNSLKSIRFFLFTFLAVGLFCGEVISCGNVWAAEAQPLKIAVVDLTRVFKEYKKTQKMETALENLSKAKQSERDKKVSEIKDMKDELALLNDAARDQKRQAFEDQLKGLSEFDQQTKEGLRDQRETSIGTLLKEIEAVVSLYAKDKGFDLVLSDRAILYRSDAVDVSGDVIAVLNQQDSGKDGKSS